MKTLKLLLGIAIIMQLNMHAMDEAELDRRKQAIQQLAEIHRMEITVKRAIADEELAKLAQEINLTDKDTAEKVTIKVCEAIFAMSEEAYDQVSEDRLDPQHIAQKFEKNLNC